MRGYLYGLTEFRQRYDTPVTKEEDKAAAADFKAHTPVYSAANEKGRFKGAAGKD